MRGQCIRSARAKKRCNHAYSRPTLCHGVPRIFLTAPLSYEAVAIHLGQCEKLLRYVKLATSSMADERQHREHRLHQHTVLPLTALTQFEVAGIPLRGMEAGVAQDDHPPINLLNQPLKGVVDVSTIRLSSRHFLSWSCCMTPLL